MKSSNSISLLAFSLLLVLQASSASALTITINDLTDNVTITDDLNIGKVGLNNAENNVNYTAFVTGLGIPVFDNMAAYLKEPGSNQASDEVIVSVSTIGSSTLFLDLTFLSDLPNTETLGITAPSFSLTENGAPGQDVSDTFIDLQGNHTSLPTGLRIIIKSDIPEPPVLPLVLAGFAGLVFANRGRLTKGAAKYANAL